MIFLLVLFGNAKAALSQSGCVALDADGVPMTVRGAAIEP
jgi:hypothetical protein